MKMSRQAIDCDRIC